MNLTDYIEYFKQVAKSNKALAHEVDGIVSFRRLDIQEALSAMKDGIKHMCMFLEMPKYGARDNESDNPRKLIKGSFLVVQPVTKGDHEDFVLKMEECGDVCEQILAKIRNDLKKYTLNKSHTFKLAGFNLDSVEIDEAGPVYGNCYGYIFSFTINVKWRNNLVLNNSEWYNDTAFTI